MFLFKEVRISSFRADSNPTWWTVIFKAPFIVVYVIISTTGYGGMYYLRSLRELPLNRVLEIINFDSKHATFLLLDRFDNEFTWSNCSLGRR